MKIVSVRIIKGNKASQCENCGTDTIRHTVCEDCCMHDERDHGICLDCGNEDDGSGSIDHAMDMMDLSYN